MSAQEGLVERLLRLNACEQGCYGRCKECPDDVAREASERITSLESELAEQQRGNAKLMDDIEQIVLVRAENARLLAVNANARELFQDALLQIEYLHEKFQPTSTGEAVLSRLRAALAGHEQAGARETVVIPREQFDRLTAAIANPPEPNDALRALMAGDAPTMTAEQMREAAAKVADSWTTSISKSSLYADNLIDVAHAEEIANALPREIAITIRAIDPASPGKGGGA